MPKLEKEDEKLFGSRFFEEERGFEGVTRFMAKRFRIESEEFRAVYVPSTKRLVVRASEEIHEQLQKHLIGGVPVKVKTEVSLLNLEKVELGRSHLDWEKARKVSALSGLSELGKASSFGNDVFTVKLETLRNREDLESRFTFQCEGEDLLMKSGLNLIRGVSQVVLLGSPDGRKTWALELKQDLLLPDGTNLDDWILDEKDGSFLKQERLAGFLRKAEFKKLDLTKEVQAFPAPEFFCLDFLPLHDEETVFPDHRTATGLVPFQSDHPELGKGKWKDLYEASFIFREDGGRLKMKEGELFLYRQSMSKFYAKMGPENLKLLQQLFAESKADPPMHLEFELAEVSSEEKLTPEKLGKAKVTRMAGGVCLPGQSGLVEVDKGMAVEMELQIDRDEERIEGRVTLVGKNGDLKKPELKAGFLGAPGKPIILSQSFAGGKWTAIVVTVRIVKSGKRG